MEDLERKMRENPLCEGLADDQIALLVGCTRNLPFRAGEYLMREVPAKSAPV